MKNDQTPLPPPAESLAVPLIGRKRALSEALAERDAKLSAMYLGALAAVSMNNNPERLIQAAHSLRELMEKLPQYLDVERREKAGVEGFHLRAKIQELKAQWDDRTLKSACYAGGEWKGEIDAPLRRHLKGIEKFFPSFSAAFPKRQLQAKNAIRDMDRSNRTPPPSIELLQVKIWQEMSDYFQLVSHHGPATSDPDFDAHLTELEEFLLTRMRPRTYDDLVQIADLVRETEAEL
jgi:hypothetical protein